MLKQQLELLLVLPTAKDGKIFAKQNSTQYGTDEFYHQLRTAPLKTEALRQAQLAMLKEQVLIKDGQLQLPDRVIPIPEEIASTGLTTLSHPYFWSAFTVIGNWN